MAIFKYTVANKEGKKLNGTVEAPDEQTARVELNDLGFSIFILQETQELPKINPKLAKFAFEALDKNSKLLTGTIPANNEDDAFNKLYKAYSLTVTAIWPQNATPEQIDLARKQWEQKLKSELTNVEEEIQENREKSLEDQKEEEFTKIKIEKILAEVNQMLTEFEPEFQAEEKLNIKKKINKLLRIKNSKNLKYILATAKDLLEYIRQQEEYLRQKGHEEQRLQLKLQTRKLLDQLNKSAKPDTLADDIVDKIERWENANKKKGNTFLENMLIKIKSIFETPLEIKAIKDQISLYNHQIWEFVKLYFKEPTPEYKQKVKNTIKTIWNQRQKSVHTLKQAKMLLRERHNANGPNENMSLAFLKELNSLTGWLLTFYLFYYFVSLYLGGKNFGISKVPQGFAVHESQIFKYLLGILFLLHASTAVKINFLKQSRFGSLALTVFFVFGSIVVLLNF